MIYLQLFLAFMKIGFCSFGGATMVPVINDEVLRYGWMTPAEVADIVAIAEMTPGSLGINCATFVGIRTAGISGALCASFGVMVPSLTVCLLAAHFIFKLKDNPYLESALRGVRPASLGMLVSAAVVLFATTYLTISETAAVSAGAAVGSAGTGASVVPGNLAGISVSWNLLAIGAVCFYLLAKKKLSIPKTILAAAVLGLLIG